MGTCCSKSSRGCEECYVVYTARSCEASWLSSRTDRSEPQSLSDPCSTPSDRSNMDSLLSDEELNSGGETEESAPASPPLLPPRFAPRGNNVVANPSSETHSVSSLTSTPAEEDPNTFGMLWLWLNDLREWLAKLPPYLDAMVAWLQAFYEWVEMLKLWIENVAHSSHTSAAVADNGIPRSSNNVEKVATNSSKNDELLGWIVNNPKQTAKRRASLECIPQYKTMVLRKFASEASLEKSKLYFKKQVELKGITKNKAIKITTSCDERLDVRQATYSMTL